MSGGSLFSIFLVAVLALACSAAEQAVPAAIGQIRVRDNVTVSTTQVLQRVQSRVGDVFDPVVAGADARNIAELPAVQQCYYTESVEDGRLILTFVVIESGVVRSIDLRGNRQEKSDTLRKKLDLVVGNYLDPIVAEAGKMNLLEYYRGRGYAFAGIELDREAMDRGSLIYVINEGPRVAIKKVFFSGNIALKSSDLSEVIKIKNRRFAVLAAYYNPENIAADVSRLKDVYLKEGFLDVAIEAREHFSADNSGVNIEFAISEGKAYSVGRVIIEGNSHFPQDSLLPLLKLGPGDRYNERTAQADAARVLAMYREYGFVDAMVDHLPRFISADMVDSVLKIDEGRRFRIGRVDISGNKTTQDRVIRRVLDEHGFAPGAWYNADLARGDGTGYLEKEVRATAVTESVVITAFDPNEAAQDRKDVQVKVVEGRTGIVMLGAGVGSDSGAIGQFVFDQRNFNIKDWPDSMGDFLTGKGFRGGGQRLRIALEPGTKLSEYSVSFSEPYINDRPISFETVGSQYDRERESYDEGRLRGFVTLEKRYRNRWRRNLSLRLEDVNVGGVEIDAPREITSVRGGNMIAGIKLGVRRDLTDDRFNPTSGTIFDLSYEQVGGDHTFGIVQTGYRWYKTIREDLAGRKTVFASRLHAGSAVGSAPPFEKFYAGGSRSIRGFEYRGVSTRGTNPITLEKDDPVGSDWIVLANAEVSVPLSGESFAGLFFVDSGAVDTGTYRISVGTGVQILIPQWFGPVPMRLELAVPVVKEDLDDTQVFSFSVGRLF